MSIKELRKAHPIPKITVSWKSWLAYVRTLPPGTWVRVPNIPKRRKQP